MGGNGCLNDRPKTLSQEFTIMLRSSLRACVCSGCEAFCLICCGRSALKYLSTSRVRIELQRLWRGSQFTLAGTSLMKRCWCNIWLRFRAKRNGSILSARHCLKTPRRPSYRWTGRPTDWLARWIGGWCGWWGGGWRPGHWMRGWGRFFGGEGLWGQSRQGPSPSTYWPEQSTIPAQLWSPEVDRIPPQSWGL